MVRRLLMAAGVAGAVDIPENPDGLGRDRSSTPARSASSKTPTPLALDHEVGEAVAERLEPSGVASPLTTRAQSGGSMSRFSWRPKASGSRR
ncbi:MAG: hypothetical protein R3D25_22690 [Geminicoccaceae bacterium]